MGRVVVNTAHLENVDKQRDSKKENNFTRSATGYAADGHVFV